MRVAIMQPYFMPYIGYFQLINAVDKFVIYDNIQYTKKGWINRNRILLNGKDTFITLPLKKSSDYLDVCERYISDDFDKKKMLNYLNSSYNKAPYFKDIYPVLCDIINNSEKNLFSYIYNSIIEINKILGISTKIIISSSLNIDHSTKNVDKVLAICKELGATEYYNAIGGVELYDKELFKQNGITLNFLKTLDIKYPQFSSEFIPYLSIIDVLMFNSPSEIRDMLSQYETV